VKEQKRSMWQTSVVVNYLQTFFHQPSPKSKLLHFRLHIFISSGSLGQSAVCFRNKFAFLLFAFPFLLDLARHVCPGASHVPRREGPDQAHAL
jgi:hypothetical protein